MTAQTRDALKSTFKDTARPSGSDFADLIDSFLNKSSEGLAIDADGNLVLARGVRLGNSAGTVAGGLRFSGGQVQFFDGATWTSLSTGGGAFQPTGGTANVAYNAGNVGINLAANTSPTYRLEVNLASNTATSEQVRFGNVVVSNGSQASGSFAMFSHKDHASNTNYALRQSPTGAVQLNAPANQVVSICQGGGSAKLGIAATGQVIVGGATTLTGAADQPLQVQGKAFKTDPSPNWEVASDERVKEDVQDLELGLAELRQVRPVRFRYNGRGGTTAGVKGVGVLGQEIEKVIPETIRRLTSGAVCEPGLDEMRIFDPAALTYALINAVKELAQRVDSLETALASATKPRKSPK